MKNFVVETSYPVTFRKKDAKELGENLKNLHCVVLIGMKRVGINNFLRFFLYHEDISKIYIDDGKKHLFIPVDFHDLVELEIFPFWTLTLKRIVDAVETSNLDLKIKKEIEDIFLHTIQFQDIFLTIDGIRRCLVKIVEAGFLPTLFFDRFDRIKDVVTPQFYGNLQGLKDATNHKLTYVFTSFKKLDDLAPLVFTKTSLSVFARNMFIKPAENNDMRTIFKVFKKKYDFELSLKDEKLLFTLVDGYVQYLHLALILLNEKKKALKNGKLDLFKELTVDERINLQSEELWENLAKDEKDVLLKVVNAEKITKQEKKNAKYLWDMGFVEEGRKNIVFSPLFEYYLKQKEKEIAVENLEFTKKENLLFIFLKEKVNEICEREEIVSAVWPEVEAMGVSDWAIDRLVARVRNKLKVQKGGLEVQTVKTRGFKLLST
ncbi:MAG: helix-turn-helix domain-containing protein [bacterium]|nr:helix-turn-helix domain-containing protein [bacterium]